MSKYVCTVNLVRIVEAESKDQACEKFIEYHDFEDLYPECKEYRKTIKIKNKNIIK
jgi:hypothetical protein